MSKAFLYLTATLTLVGCGTKDQTPPRPAFMGRVLLVDEFGAPQGSSAGVQISVDDVAPAVTTQSAADGTFSLGGVADGDHQLSYAKTGYATYRFGPANASATQTTTLADVTLSPVSTTTARLDPVQYLKPKYVISGYVSPKPTPTQPRFHRLYFQRYDNVLVKRPAELNYNLTVGGPTRADGYFTDTLTASQFQAVNIYNGRILIWATGDNPAATPFRDPKLDVLVYPAAVPAQQLTYGYLNL